jgi:hypothetical protein
MQHVVYDDEQKNHAALSKMPRWHSALSATREQKDHANLRSIVCAFSLETLIKKFPFRFIDGRISKSYQPQWNQPTTLLFVLGSFGFIIGVSYLSTPNATAVAAMPDKDDDDAASFPPTQLLRLHQTTFRGILQSYAVEVEV